MTALEIYLLTTDQDLVTQTRTAMPMIQDGLANGFFRKSEVAPQESLPPLNLVIETQADLLVQRLKEGLVAPIFLIIDQTKPAPGSPSLVKTLNLLAPDLPIAVITNTPGLDPITPTPLNINLTSLADPQDFSRFLVDHLCQHWAMPFWSALRKYAAKLNQYPWHTPGHGGGNSFAKSSFLSGFGQSYAPRGSLALLCDISVSVDDLGDLSMPYQESPMTMAMVNSAEVFGAARTIYSTNGSSTANKILLMTLLDPGDVVIMDRNCHKSIHQAMIFAGAIPYYVNPQFDVSLGISTPITYDQIQAILSDEKLLKKLQPRAFCLTTCTYEGVLYPIKELAALCEKSGIVFYADEAWLPHGRFHPFYGPVDGGSTGRYNALGTGAHDSAHLVVQSTHKTLSAFSQSSMLHVSHSFLRCLAEAECGGPDHPYTWLAKRFVDQNDFLGYLAEVSRFWVSSSPNYPIIASLDCATSQMAGEGFSTLSWLLQQAEELASLARELNATVDLEDILPKPEDRHMLRRDPLKFAVALKPGKDEQGRPHLQAFLANLQAEGIAWEKHSIPQPTISGQPDNQLTTGGMVLFQFTIGTSQTQVDRLKTVLRANRKHLGKNQQNTAEQSKHTIMKGQVEVTPRHAHYAEGELVPLLKAGNRISCQMVTPYPPGIPSLLPGLPIDPQEAARIHLLITAQESNVHGLVKQNNELYIRVLRPDELKLLQTRYREHNPDIAASLDLVRGKGKPGGP